MRLKTIIASLLVLSVALTAYGQGREDSKTKEKEMGITHLTHSEFLKKVYDYESNPNEWKFNGDKPAIVDFYATWCGPCKALGPILEDLAKEYEGKVDFYKVDIDQERELTAAFGIRSVPTLLIIPASGDPSMSAGLPSKAALKAAIEQMLQ